LEAAFAAHFGRRIPIRFVVAEFDINRCMDGGEHVWGPEDLHTGPPGTALDGQFFSAECVRCGTGKLRAANGGSFFDLFVAHLANLGLDPQPIEGTL
jgi:hypothetical protein